MPIALLLIGAIALSTALKGTYADLGSQLAKDFTGPDNFLYWIAAVGLVGGLGYIPYLEKPTRYLIALIIVVMFLSNNGIFANLLSTLGAATPSQDVPISSQPSVVAAANSTTPTQGTSGTQAPSNGVQTASNDVAAGLSAASSAASLAKTVIGLF